VVQLWVQSGGRSRTRRGRPPRRARVDAGESSLTAEGVDKLVRDAAAQAFHAIAADTVPELWGALTDAGKEALAREAADAYVSAAPEDRSVALGKVYEAWHRTWLLRQTPGYEEAVERAGKTTEELGERAYGLEELRGRLDLPPTT
jgi:hypothetical protein